MENPNKTELTHKNIAKVFHVRNEQLKATLRETIFLDSLTNLPNDKAFKQMLNGLQLSWERNTYINKQEDQETTQGTIVELDLTGLHDTNYKFSRETGGDHYLKSVAKTLTDVLRAQDRCFRLGTASDEFILQLPGKSTKDDINKVLDKIDENLQETQLESQNPYPGIEFGLSYSIAFYGVNCSPKDAYSKVDINMSEAKESKVSSERIGDVGRIYCD